MIMTAFANTCWTAVITVIIIIELLEPYLEKFIMAFGWEQ